MSEGEFLESGQRIADKVRTLIEAQPSDAPVMLVVAFWGQGAEAVLAPGKTYKVVCNLKMGSTNPAVIERLMTAKAYSVEVKHMPDLHAKVCLGKQGAVVSSANMSNQGLGLDESKAGWAEAGIYLPSTHPAWARINGWAWDIWRTAKTVTQADLRAARATFDTRATGSMPDLEESDTGRPNAEIVTSDFGLTEGLLFKPDKDANVKNALRAASEVLHGLYADCFKKKPNQYESRMLAQVANLLWVHAGHASPWRDGVFQLPQEVVSRWREMNTKDEQVLDFLVCLSEHSEAPQPIRDAALDVVTRAWKRYTA